MKRPTLFLAVTLTLSLSLSLVYAAQQETAETLRSASSSISHFQLKGTLFTRSLKPVAMIEDTRSGHITMYEAGDILEDKLEVVSITRGEVVVKAPQQEYILSFPAGGIIQPRPSLSRAGAKEWYNIAREGDLFIVDEQTIANAISRTRDIMSNVKIKPYYADGKQCGIALTRLTPVGILKEVGISKGDVVTNVNGLKVNTPYQIFNAYRKLRNEKEIKVDILRDKKPLTLTYKVRNVS